MRLGMVSMGGGHCDPVLYYGAILVHACGMCVLICCALLDSRLA